MSGLLRAIKYATFRAARVVGITVLMAVGFVFYFALLNDQELTIPNLVGRFPLVLMAIGVLMTSLYGMVDIVTYMQLTLSYGSTRRYAFVSQVYMCLLQAVAVELILAVSCLLIPADWQFIGAKTLLLTAQNTLFFGSGVALLGGLLIYRFGKVAYWLFVMVMACGGGALSGFCGYMDRDMSVFLDVAQLAHPVLHLIGLLCAVIMAVACWFTIRRCEVRV